MGWCETGKMLCTGWRVTAITISAAKDWKYIIKVLLFLRAVCPLSSHSRQIWPKRAVRVAQCTKITERNTNRKEETSLIPNSWWGSWEFKQNYSQASKSKALLKLHFHHHSDSSLFWECSPPLILDESFSRKSMKLFTLHLTWGITLLYSSFSWTEKWISISIRNTKRR